MQSEPINLNAVWGGKPPPHKRNDQFTDTATRALIRDAQKMVREYSVLKIYSNLEIIDTCDMTIIIVYHDNILSNNRNCKGLRPRMPV